MNFMYDLVSRPEPRRFATGVPLGTLALLVLAALALGLPTAALARTPASRCTVTGTPGPDVLRGTPGPDVICGGGGADRLYGGSGDDVILGGSGSDRLTGGPGSDVEKGGSGQDVCLGSSEQGDRITCRVVRSSGPQVGSGSAGPGSDGSGPPPPDESAPLVEPPNRTGTPEECEHATSFCLPVPQLPPTVFEARLSTETVDTSLGDAEPTVDLVIGDEEEVSSGTAVVEAPDGARQTLAIPSTGGRGSYAVTVYRRFDVELPFKVAASTPPGRYQLVEISLRDPSGRETTLDREEVDALLEYHPWLQAYQGPDVTPPVLTGISQDSVDVYPASNSVVFGLTLKAADYQSGVASISWTIGYGWGWGWQQYGGTSWRSGGSVTESSLGASIDVEASLGSSGSWPIHEMIVTDNAGNETVYTQEDLEAAGLPTELTESG